jgi:hypothetical protein
MTVIRRPIESTLQAPVGDSSLAATQGIALSSPPHVLSAKPSQAIGRPCAKHFVAAPDLDQPLAALATSATRAQPQRGLDGNWALRGTRDVLALPTRPEVTTLPVSPQITGSRPVLPGSGDTYGCRAPTPGRPEASLAICQVRGGRNLGRLGICCTPRTIAAHRRGRPASDEARDGSVQVRIPDASSATRTFAEPTPDASGTGQPARLVPAACRFAVLQIGGTNGCYRNGVCIAGLTRSLPGIREENLKQDGSCTQTYDRVWAARRRTFSQLGLRP